MDLRINNIVAVKKQIRNSFLKGETKLHVMFLGGENNDCVDEYTDQSLYLRNTDKGLRYEVWEEKWLMETWGENWRKISDWLIEDNIEVVPDFVWVDGAYSYKMNGSPDLEYLLAKAVADRLSPRYSHRAVLWALLNPEEVPSGWLAQDNGATRKDVIVSLKERLKRYKMVKRIRLLAEELGLYPYYTVGDLKEDHQTMLYDYRDMTIEKEDLLCWSSWIVGGNCNCINHSPTDINKWDMGEEELERLLSLSKEREIEGFCDRVLPLS